MILFLFTALYAISAVSSEGLQCDFRSECCWKSADPERNWDIRTGINVNEFRRTFLVGRAKPPPSGSYLMRIETGERGSAFQSCPFCSKDGLVVVTYRHWQSPTARMDLCWKRAEAPLKDDNCVQVHGSRQSQILQQRIKVDAGKDIQLFFLLDNTASATHAVILIDRIAVDHRPCNETFDTAKVHREATYRPIFQRTVMPTKRPDIVAERVQNTVERNHVIVYSDESSEELDTDKEFNVEGQGTRVTEFNEVQAPFDENIVAGHPDPESSRGIQKLKIGKLAADEERLNKEPELADRTFTEISEESDAGVDVVKATEVPHRAKGVRSHLRTPIEVLPLMKSVTSSPRKRNSHRSNRNILDSEHQPPTATKKIMEAAMSEDNVPKIVSPTPRIRAHKQKLATSQVQAKVAPQRASAQQVAPQQVAPQQVAPQQVGAHNLPAPSPSALKEFNPLYDLVGEDVAKFLDPNYVTHDDVGEDEDVVDVISANGHQAQHRASQQMVNSAAVPQQELASNMQQQQHTVSPMFQLPLHNPTNLLSTLSHPHQCHTVGGCLFERSFCAFAHPPGTTKPFEIVKVGMSSFAQVQLEAGGTSAIEANTYMAKEHTVLFDVLEWAEDTRLLGCCSVDGVQPMQCPYATHSAAGIVMWQQARFSCPQNTKKLVFICENRGSSSSSCAVDNVRLHLAADILLLEPCQKDVLSQL